MRINDLLLESEMLLESYRDFKRVWNDTLQSADTTAGYKREWATAPDVLEALIRDNQKKAVMLTNGGIKKITSAMKVVNPVDITSWITAFKNFAKTSDIVDALRIFNAVVNKVDDIVSDVLIARVPDYKTIAKTSEYIIFDVLNEAAATKLRNQVKATWCIGSGNGYFEHYGEGKGRKTHIVFFIKAREGMVFHVSSSGGGLITSHDNQREWEVNGGNITNSRGYNHIARELGVYLKSDELPKFMKAVGMRVKDSELVEPEEIVPEAGKLEQHVLNSFARSVRNGQYPNIYKETAVRREVSSHIAQKTAPIFSRGNVFHILDDAKKLFGTLVMRDIPDNAEGVEMAADAAMCAKMIVGYLNEIQRTVVHDEVNTLAMSAQHFLNSVMDTGGRLKTTREYKDALEKTWPRVIKVISGIKEKL